MSPQPPDHTDDPLDVTAHNADVWNAAAARQDIWSTPVTDAEIDAARRGDWTVRLTPNRPVPANWFPPMQGLSILGLACGGGQQTPLYAAAGADVTVVDISSGQLDLDQRVADEHGLDITTLQTDATDLSPLGDATFDLVFHPSSNSYMSDIGAVWAEAHRVLRPGGTLLAGFNNPVIYIFDLHDLDRGVFTVRHPLPHSDSVDLSEEEVTALVSAGRALEHSHTLEQQIGGQLAAGLHLLDLYEDTFDALAISAYLPTSIATRARKPVAG